MMRSLEIAARRCGVEILLEHRMTRIHRKAPNAGPVLGIAVHRESGGPIDMSMLRSAGAIGFTLGPPALGPGIPKLFPPCSGGGTGPDAGAIGGAPCCRRASSAWFSCAVVSVCDLGPWGGPIRCRGGDQRDHRKDSDEIGLAIHANFSLSNGKQSGPRIGMEKGPLTGVGQACPGSEQEGPARVASALTSDGAARVGGACLPTGASRGGTHARCLKRQLALPVSMISQ
jgi:hypothetical protein